MNQKSRSTLSLPIPVKCHVPRLTELTRTRPNRSVSDPKLLTTEPSALNTCTRLLPESDTAMQPSPSTATKRGPSIICPAPDPFDPTLLTKVPSGLNTCTR